MINKNKFMDKKYLVVKNFISKEMSDFLFSVFLNKKSVTDFLFRTKYISPFEKIFGFYNDPQMNNHKNTFALYGDVIFDTLLYNSTKKISELTGTELFPTYTYGRIYNKGNTLERHKDREACEVSLTLNLGGDPWPIYIDPTGSINKKGKKVILNPGDTLIYKGNELEHWRNKFTGNICAQVFLHYTSLKFKNKLYDSRPMLGLPQYFKND